MARNRTKFQGVHLQPRALREAGRVPEGCCVQLARRVNAWRPWPLVCGRQQRPCVALRHTVLEMRAVTELKPGGSDTLSWLQTTWRRTCSSLPSTGLLLPSSCRLLRYYCMITIQVEHCMITAIILQYDCMITVAAIDPRSPPFAKG